MGASFAKVGHGLSHTFGKFDENATEGAGVIDQAGNEIPDALHGLTEAQARNRMFLRIAGKGLQGYGQSQSQQQPEQPNPYSDFSAYFGSGRY